MTEPETGAAITVVGLFDDDIDAERALLALKKSLSSASHVSVIARDRRAEAEQSTPLDVTQALMHSAVATVGGWLDGLAALVVPRQGRFVAAGPIGAVLGRSDSVASPSTEAPATPAESAAIGSVGIVFEAFGFRHDEAHYLENRLEAGSSVIAITSGDVGAIEQARRLFADHEAVFIGQAVTAEQVVGEAEQLLARPAVVQREDLIVTDVVRPYQRLCGGEGAHSLCGAAVLTVDGVAVGDVDDLIADPGESPSITYVIVGHGGVLGIGRKRAAVPAEIVEFTDDAVSVRADRERIYEAPPYDPDTPFSQNDERATCTFFEVELPAG